MRSPEHRGVCYAPDNTTGGLPSGATEAEAASQPLEETPEERDARRRRMMDRLDKYFSTRQTERSDDPLEETPEERDARRRRMIDRLDEYFSTRQNDENTMGLG